MATEMTTKMTDEETDEEAAFALYAANFGEKAARRNASRIARLAELVGQYGAENVELREEYTRDWTEAKALEESGVIILGYTRMSTTKTTYVVAECHYPTPTPAAPITPELPARLPGEQGGAEALDAIRVSIAVMETEPRASIRATRASRGQLWEECPSCGTEPVCAGCGYCDDHCSCGIPSAYVAGEIYGGGE